MTQPDLDPGEKLIASFTGSRSTYIREHIIMALLGSVIMYGVLQYMGNPHAWTGIVGAVMAIALRGFYVADEQLGFVWYLTDRRLIGPAERNIPVSTITRVRYIFSAVQVVTVTGDKHLIKYQGDVDATRNSITNAVPNSGA